MPSIDERLARAVETRSQLVKMRSQVRRLKMERDGVYGRVISLEARPDLATAGDELKRARTKLASLDRQIAEGQTSLEWMEVEDYTANLYFQRDLYGE